MTGRGTCGDLPGICNNLARKHGAEFRRAHEFKIAKMANNDVHKSDVGTCCWQEGVLDDMKKKIDQAEEGEIDGQPGQ
jgi:hypothetical protein